MPRHQDCGQRYPACGVCKYSNKLLFQAELSDKLSLKTRIMIAKSSTHPTVWAGFGGKLDADSVALPVMPYSRWFACHCLDPAPASLVGSISAI